MPDEKSPEEIARERGDYIDENNPPGDLVGEDDDEQDVSDESEEDEEIVAEDEDEPGDEPPEEEYDEEEEDDAPITIPKARFDEAQRKARARQEELQRRIDEMESKTQKETVDTDVNQLAEEIEDLNTKYEDFLLEGELDKAREVRRERDRKQNDLFDTRLAQTSYQTSTAAVEQMRFDAQLAQFEAKFPAINPDSADFNQELATEVADMLNVYKAGGYTATAALNKAIHYVVGDDVPKAGEDPDIVRSKRGQRARKRVAAAMKKSPPDISDKGRDSDKSGSGDGLPDITKMSPEQFDKLSEADLKKLRHDSLTDEEAAA